MRNNEETKKIEHFIPPPVIPTQEGPLHVRYDFNDGARVFLPEGDWHVLLLDDDTGNILFNCDSLGGWVTSTKKYFVRFRIKVFIKGEALPVLDEVINNKNKQVVISFPTGTLGDLIGWFHYAERFRVLHQCHLHCVMGQEIIDLLAGQYPEITFSTPDKYQELLPYSTYRVGLFFNGDTVNQPIDFRKVGFHRNSGYILGVDPRECPPRLNLTASRQISEPYVCIATQSTCQAKYWNNGYGWSEVTKHLKSLGYRVLCIDRHAHSGQGFVWNHIPYGAEDFTGNIPLQQRVDLLRHASFFIGLGSGLSWLAWAAGIPVILISGFSLPVSEFYTPWRVFNSHGCNGCWDDTSIDFNHQDYFWCPRHKGTDRQYECTRLITGQQVNKMVDSIHASIVTEEIK
ncbi:autotransporter strand-loop-strand O-heptosyltransferase [Enterobacter wuhouensis]|uniref:autotransporter strand-loop-strand O-heptosyltransferase n=1 Tax=Enterobacter wuhouensis TaxID=2529381 RepID=UPI0035250DCC